MWRTVGRVALALVIGFVVYRVSVATMSTGQYAGPGPEFCSAPEAPPHFDALTGIPVGWTCMGTSGELGEVFAPFEMSAHWRRSLKVGIAVAVLAALAMWFHGGRRRRTPGWPAAVSEGST